MVRFLINCKWPYRKRDSSIKKYPLFPRASNVEYNFTEKCILLCIEINNLWKSEECEKIFKCGCQRIRNMRYFKAALIYTLEHILSNRKLKVNYYSQT
jgi:hypothetical protein